MQAWECAVKAKAELQKMSDVIPSSSLTRTFGQEVNHRKDQAASQQVPKGQDHLDGHGSDQRLRERRCV